MLAGCSLGANGPTDATVVMVLLPRSRSESNRPRVTGDDEEMQQFVPAPTTAGVIRTAGAANGRTVAVQIALVFLITAQVVRPANPCAVCHPREVAGYMRTGMARSLRRGVEGVPNSSFTHRSSQTTFTITHSGMQQGIERHGVRADHHIDFVVGSGSHALGFLVKAGDYLFQSPISFYNRRAVWDVAPGYEQYPAPDFTRPVTLGCVLCHAGKPLPMAGNNNGFEPAVFAEEGISCERCHGPSEQHLRSPSRNNIVNPKKLPPPARESVCEQCHLSGEARILNPGLQFADFRPGMALEEVYTIYVNQRDPVTSEEESVKVIGHVEQLALSACVRKSSDRMWCGTCHDPHDPPDNPRQYYRSRCLSCHGGIEQSHAGPAEDCVGCHMRSRPAADGGHTAFTDHHITRRPELPGTGKAASTKLVAWRDAPAALDARNLGLAHLAVGRRALSSEHMREAQRLLSACRGAFSNDPVVSEALGLIALTGGEPREAAKLFERAATMDPKHAEYWLDVGIADKEAGSAEESIHALERAIELDPAIEEAYGKLAEVYAKEGRVHDAQRTMERYWAFFTPVSLSARAARQALTK